jgi:hypothetical protein
MHIYIYIYIYIYIGNHLSESGPVCVVSVQWCGMYSVTLLRFPVWLLHIVLWHFCIHKFVFMFCAVCSDVLVDLQSATQVNLSVARVHLITSISSVTFSENMMTRNGMLQVTLFQLGKLHVGMKERNRESVGCDVRCGHFVMAG